MTFARITLESFEDETLGPNPVLSPDYKKGFDEGVKQAEATLAAQQALALADINATFDDMAFGYAEARSELLDQIRPILAQVAETLLPALAQETFTAYLLETLDRTFGDVTDLTIEVAVAPNMVAVLQETDPKFKPVADPSLALGQAVLRRGDTHIMIDIPTLVAALQAALQGLDETQRTQAHG